MKKKLKQFLQKIKPSSKKADKYEEGVAGLFTDEDAFLQAVKKVFNEYKKSPITIMPYPVHGLEDAANIKRSWIPYVSLIGGISGCSFGVWFTWWTSASSWPINVAGKPFWSLPAFIPVIFELTILFAAFSAIGALFYACRIPVINPPVIDPDLTCSKFAIFFPSSKLSKEEAKKILEEVKAIEIKETLF